MYVLVMKNVGRDNIGKLNVDHQICHFSLYITMYIAAFMYVVIMFFLHTYSWTCYSGRYPAKLFGGSITVYSVNSVATELKLVSYTCFQE